MRSYKRYLGLSLILSAFLLIISSCDTADQNLSEELDCKRFRYGKYSLVDSTIHFASLSERDKDYQIETDLTNGEVSKYKIEWANECEYSLAMIEGSEELMEFMGENKLRVKIIETRGDSLKFEVRLDGSDIMESHWMEKID